MPTWTLPCRLPFPNVVSCNSLGPKELHIKSTFYTTCKAHNLDRPYVHQVLAQEASVLIQLEFASMDSLMLQLMQVLDISKTPNPTERDARLKVLPPTASAWPCCSFHSTCMHAMSSHAPLPRLLPARPSDHCT